MCLKLKWTKRVDMYSLSTLTRVEKGSKKHNYNCNIRSVSVYTNVSANYMFRPLLVRPSSGWIPQSEKMYNSAIQTLKSGRTISRLQKWGVCTSYWYKYMYCLYQFVHYRQASGGPGVWGFLHCLVGWLGVRAVRCYGNVFFLRCIWWPLQVYCCGGDRLWCWCVMRACGVCGVMGMSVMERKGL